MKNILLHLHLFICAALLLSSCNNNNLSLTKRQYRSGYYFSRAGEPAFKRVKVQDSVFDVKKPKKNVEPLLGKVAPEMTSRGCKINERDLSISLMFLLDLI